MHDVAAIGSMRALRDSNLEVPKDIWVTGFDVQDHPRRIGKEILSAPTL